MKSQFSTMLDPLAILRRSFRRRRRGKIGNLPEPVREQINCMLDDGLAYAEIIARLADAGRGLNKDNLSRWRHHDHQDWLEEQRLKQALKRHPQFASSQPIKDLIGLKSEFGPERLRGIIQSRPHNYATLLQHLAKFANPTQHQESALKDPDQAPAPPTPELLNS